MGIETVLFAALTGISAISKMSAANDQAEAITKNAEAQAKSLKTEGELATEERAKKLRYDAARQTSSFLTSGITLEGTPEAVLGETYDTGKADILNIKKGYNTQMTNVISAANAQSKSIISSARSAVIGDIAKSFGGMSFGSGGMFDAPSNSLGGDLAMSNAVYGGSGNDWIH